MSDHLTKRMWESGLPPHLKPLASAMLVYGNGHGRSIFPSLRNLSLCLGISLRGVQRKLEELREFGVFVPVAERRRTDDGRWARRRLRPNKNGHPRGGSGWQIEYHFQANHLPPVKEQCHIRHPSVKQNSDNVARATVTLAAENSDTDTHETVTPQVARSLCTDPKEDPKRDPKGDPILKTAHPRGVDEFPDTAFAQLQKAYPASRRVGGASARRAFQSALNTSGGEVSREAHFATILAAVEQHKRSEQWQNPKHIPLMTKWLEQQRWHQTLPEPSPFPERTIANLAADQRARAMLRQLN